MSTKGHEGPRRKPLEDTEGREEFGLFMKGNFLLGTPLQRQHICPRRAAKNCNGGPRRTIATAAIWSIGGHKGGGELQRRLQLLLSTKGHEELQRQRRARRAAENTDCNLIFPRRATGTATPLSTEGTEGRGELQRHCNILVYPRRAGETFVHGGHGLSRRTARRLQLPFVREGPRRKPLPGHNLVYPRRAAGTAGDRG